MWRMYSFKAAQTPIIFLGHLLVSQDFGGAISIYHSSLVGSPTNRGSIVAFMHFVTKDWRSAILADMSISDGLYCCQPCVSGVLICYLLWRRAG